MIGSGVVASDDHPSLFRILDEPRKSASHRFESTRVVAFGTERPLVFSEFPEQGISVFRIERDLLFRHSGPPAPRSDAKLKIGSAS